jgi:hypothetical protein
MNPERRILSPKLVQRPRKVRRLLSLHRYSEGDDWIWDEHRFLQVVKKGRASVCATYLSREAAEKTSLPDKQATEEERQG